MNRRELLAALSALGGAACMPVRTADIPPNLPLKGSRQPQLVVQEVGDFQCPFCADVAPDVDRLMQRYGDRIALVWRNFPLKSHLNAQLAAEAALEVRAQKGDETFWRYHDVLFAHQDALDGPSLIRYASAFGVDERRMSRALELGVHAKDVARDKREIASLSIPGFGVPTFLIGPGAFVGGYGYDELSAIVEDQL